MVDEGWGRRAVDFATLSEPANCREGLSDQERATAAWARKIVADPNATDAADVQQLRDAGLHDPQIFAITLFVALRLAFSTVNDALGAHPDQKLVEKLPPQVAAAVTYGRPPVG